MRRWLKNSQGAVAVEFAIVAPVMMLFLMGMFETGRLYFTRGSMRYAVNEAARYAMVNATAANGTIEQRVRDNLIGMSPDSATVAVTNQVVGGKTYKQISLSYSFNTIVGRLVQWPAVSLNTQSTVPILP